MGYSVGTSPKGLDTFNSSPQTAADLNRLRELIELVGNAREGSTDEREALVAPQKYPGLLFFDNDAQALYVATSSSTAPWALLMGVRTIANIVSFGADYSFGPGTTSRVSRRGDVVHINVQVVRAQDMLVNNTAFVLPPGYRPYADTYITGTITTGGSQGNIGFLVSASTGNVTVNYIDAAASAGHPRAAWVVGTFEAA